MAKQDKAYPLKKVIKALDDQEACLKLIQGGLDPDTRLPNGNPLLTEMTLKGHSTVARALIENGADINTTNDNDETALVIAVFQKYTTLAQYMIDNGADVHKNKQILRWAVDSQNPNAVRMLLDAGAEVNVPDDKNNRTPLGWAFMKNDEAIIELLLKAGAEFSHDDQILCKAVQNKSAKIVRMLLDRGADPNIPRPDKGRTPLGWAVATGDAEIVNMLLDAGADPNVRDMQYGDLLLEWSLFKRDDGGITENLVRNGADIHATSKSGEPLIQVAEQYRGKDFAKTLLAASFSNIAQKGTSKKRKILRPSTRKTRPAPQ
ncbi:MAG: ankyrin repeat domain-containing protein [Alphaproteobacteria bacterium]|nr:ankyrin repeat domain-containing protein [Alphaproteobacteria bacterium]